MWCRANAALHVEQYGSTGGGAVTAGLKAVAAGVVEPASGISTAVVTPAIGTSGANSLAMGVTPQTLTHSVAPDVVQQQ